MVDERLVRQREAEGAAAAVRGLHPDVPAVCLDDPAADGEPDPAALHAPLDAREHPEDAARVLAIDRRSPLSRTVTTHSWLSLEGRDLDRGRLPRARNLTALPTRFCSTRRSWRGSPCTSGSSPTTSVASASSSACRRSVGDLGHHVSERDALESPARRSAHSRARRRSRSSARRVLARSSTQHVAGRRLLAGSARGA